MDRPEGDGMSLVLPFVACQSKGGPYEDTAFAAGFQCGEIDRALAAAVAASATTVRFPMVRTALLPQLELIAMHRGYTKVAADVSGDWPDWCVVTFTAPAHSPEGGIDSHA